MKKQSRFAIFLLAMGVAVVIVLITGISGLQRFMGLSRAAQQQYEATLQESRQIHAVLERRDEWERLLEEYGITLASLDKDLTDYMYLPTYLKQLQHTTEQTGNTLRSIRPRPLAKLDNTSALLKASHGRWLTDYPDIAAAANEQLAPATSADHTPPAGAPPATTYHIQQFTLEVEGTYVSILHLLDALRSFPKLVYVHSVNLTPQQRDKPELLRAVLETYTIITPDQYRSPNHADMAGDSVDRRVAVRGEGAQP